MTWYSNSYALINGANRFHYMAVADERQRYMPQPDDRMPGRCQPLAYQEAVKLVNPIEPGLRGEVPLL